MSIIDQIKEFFAGDPTKKTIKRYEERVNEINSFEKTIQILNDDELKSKTNEFKELLNQGKKLNDILPEAFAWV